MSQPAEPLVLDIYGYCKSPIRSSLRKGLSGGIPPRFAAVPVEAIEFPWGKAMKTRKIDAANGALAVHESAGRGPPVVLIHGNSSSSRAFSRQLDGRLGRSFRLIAIDLPGHGASDDAEDTSAYSLPGHARAIGAVLDALGIDEAHFVGWSLGGHVALEMAPDLREPRGFVIFGTPPLTSGEAMSEAFLPNPAMKVTFQESIDSLEASAYVAGFFGPGFADILPFFLDDVLRPDGRARSNLGASLVPGGARDEDAGVRDLKVPLAVLHGDEEQLVNGRYFDSVAMPTLWRGAVQMIPDAGHTPQWETPQVFDALIETFVRETA